MKINSNNPLITFAITTYKRPKFLKESIESVLSQDYKNFRVIIGNDDPLEIISFKSIGIKEDSRIQILNYKKNIGEIQSMNLMLSKVKTEWFSWLADDDILHPQFISKFIEVNNSIKNQNVSAILCDYIEDKETNNFITNSTVSNLSKTYDFESLIANFLGRKIKVIGVYGFLKTQIVKEIGGIKNFGGGLPLYCDTAFTIELAAKGKIIVNQSQLFLLRRHEGSVSSSISNWDEIIPAEKDFLNFLKILFKSRLPDKKSYDSFIFLTIRWFCYNNLGETLRQKNQLKAFSLFQFIYLQKKWLYEIKPAYFFLFFMFVLLQVYLIIFNYLKKNYGFNQNSRF
jgi:glycosyltransferase involved in cell wall biosynthesis